MISLKHGNIFNTKAQTIVNTVNCVGVMGAGIAYEFRLRYPKMFEKYCQLCDPKNPNRLQIGKLWLYREGDRNILNFPTKMHWKFPSKIEYLELGLSKFVDIYKQKNITSCAFPLLGAQNGGLNSDEVRQIMIDFLEPLDIECEIWGFDPNESDDLYDKFALNFNLNSLKARAKEMGLKNVKFSAIQNAIKSGEYHSLSSLLRAPGIGDKSLEACFKLVMSEPKSLFD